jgi:Protein of unknown function (DUF1559)
MVAPRRPGFHMLDLVVLVAIALVTIAVALPAIRDAREAANRAACSHQLMQIAQAAFAYHDANKTLPPGWMWPAHLPKAAVGQSNGPFPFLLPYLGQKPLFEKIENRLIWDPKNAGGDFWCTSGFQAAYNVPALDVAATPLSVMHCPSDVDAALLPCGDKRQPDVFGHKLFVIGTRTTTQDKGGKPGDPKTSNAADPLAVRWGQSASGEWSADLHSLPFALTGNKAVPFGRVNYMPVAGLGGGDSPFYQQFEGVFTGRSDITLAAIGAADGASHTLMFGETTGQFYPTMGDNTLQMNLFSATGAATARGLQQRCAPGVLDGWKPPFATCADTSFTTGMGQKARFDVFSSAHPAGVQFVFCDGSVRMIRRERTWVLGSPDWYLLQQLAGFHDGFDRETKGLLP